MILSGKERNQERNLYQKVYDHCKTKFDNVFGPKNKGKRPGKFYLIHPKNMYH